jgi:hypothetical protein
MLVSLSLARKFPRLSKEKFLKLSSKEQTAYLDEYKKSSHRFLLKGNKETPEAAPEKKKGKKKGKKDKIRRLTRNEYNALSDKDRERYDATYTKNSHKMRFKKGGKKGKKDVSIDGRESKQEARQRRKELMSKVDTQRNVIHDDGAGVINRESVKALALIKPEHLHQGAANIENNRHEIRDLVEHQLRDKPELSQRGFAALRDMMHGGLLEDKSKEDDEDIIEGEFEELPNAPAVVDNEDDDVIEGEFEEIEEAPEKPKFSKERLKEFEKDGGKFKPRRGDDKPYINENGEKEYYDDGDPVTVGDMREIEYDEIRKSRAGDRKKSKSKKKRDRAHKDSKKQRDGHSLLNLVVKTAILGAGIGMLAMGAGPLGMIIGRGILELWSDMPSLSAANGLTDEDSDTVDEIITQTISYMRNMDLDDLKGQSTEMFTALSAARPDVDVFNIVYSAVLPLVEGRPSGRPGKNFFGKTFSDMETLAAATEHALQKAGILIEHERYSDDIDKSHHFYCRDRNKTVVALGMFEEHHLYHFAFVKG